MLSACANGSDRWLPWLGGTATGSHRWGLLTRRPAGSLRALHALARVDVASATIPGVREGSGADPRTSPSAKGGNSRRVSRTLIRTGPRACRRAAVGSVRKPASGRARVESAEAASQAGAPDPKSRIFSGLERDGGSKARDWHGCRFRGLIFLSLPETPGNPFSP